MSEEKKISSDSNLRKKFASAIECGEPLDFAAARELLNEILSSK